MNLLNRFARFLRFGNAYLAINFFKVLIRELSTKLPKFSSINFLGKSTINIATLCSVAPKRVKASD